MRLIASLLLLIAIYVTNGYAFENEQGSFAEEYRQLRILLQKVNSRETAEQLKPAIKKQIEELRENQFAGEQHFQSLSEQDQQLFIKRFQQNRFHCGEVTQVMEERQRILLQPELSDSLYELMVLIP